MVPLLPKGEKIQGLKLVIARAFKICPRFPEPCPPEKFQDLRDAWSVMTDALEEGNMLPESELFFLRRFQTCRTKELWDLTLLFVTQWIQEYRPKT